jgi:hypothetical protein
MTSLNSKRYQAYCFIGKIHMRLTAGGGPVAVKRRAVNRSTKLRTSLYIHTERQTDRQTAFKKPLVPVQGAQNM